MEKRKPLLNTVEKAVAQIAKKTALAEANTACAFLSYQPEEPQEVKKLRKF